MPWAEEETPCLAILKRGITNVATKRIGDSNTRGLDTESV